MGFEHLVRGSVSLPVPDFLVEWLHLGTLGLHLAVMTLLVGLTLLYARDLFLQKKADVPRLPVWMAFAINTGVAPLLFSQALYADFIYTSSILMAGWWLGMILFLMAAYSLSYVATSSARSEKTRKAAALALSLILLFVASVLVSNIHLMNHPDSWSSFSKEVHGWVFGTGGTKSLLKWGHVVLAAIFHGLVFRKLFGKDGEEKSDAKTMGALMSLLAATGLAIYMYWPVGARPEIASGVSALWLPVVSSGVLLGLFMVKRYRLAGVLAVVNLLVMVGLSESVRFYLIQPVIRSGMSDYGSVVMFGLSLALGGVALIWMLNLPGKEVKA